MIDSTNEPNGQNWDQLLHQMRQLRQQVQDHGPLDPQEQAQATDAFRQGFIYLENQVNDIRSEGLKGNPDE